MRLLLGQPRDDARQRRIGRDAKGCANLVARQRRVERGPVDRVVDHVDLRRRRVHLLDVEVAHRLGRDHDGIRAAHQQALDRGVCGTLVLVDVDFRSKNDRHARENRGEASIQAGGQQKRMHDVRPGLAQEIANAEHIERAAASQASVPAP